jgi:hypothetical protein
MWQDYLEQLRSPDPEVRRQAIIAIGRQKDPAALAPLADVYRNDPDPGLRELAYKAGRYIRNSGADAASEPAPTPTPAFTAAPPRETSYTPPVYQVSPMAVERARGYFDHAVDAQVRGDDLKAIDLMGKALETNPDIRNDTMFINMAMDLTGMGSGAAIATLSDPGQRMALIQQRSGLVGTPRRSVDKYAPREEATWGGALIDLSIYGLVNGAVVFVSLIVAGEFISMMIRTMMLNAPSGLSGSNIEFLANFDGRQLGLPLAGLYGLLYGVLATIGLLIAQGAVHIVATSVMGGEGTLAGLIRKTTLYYTAVVAISLIVNLIVSVLSSNTTQAESLVFLQGIPSFVTFGLTFWAGKLTGDAYLFGTARGCASILLGYLLIGLAFACCIFTLSLAFSQALQGMPR